MQSGVRAVPASIGGDITVIETFVGIEPREELKAVARGAVGVQDVDSAAARSAELPGDAAAHRDVTGAAVQNAGSVAGRCAATRGDGAVFREAVGDEEALPRGGAGVPGELTHGWVAAVVVTRGGAPVLGMRAAEAGEFAAVAVLPDGEPMKHQQLVVFPVRLITVARN